MLNRRTYGKRNNQPKCKRLPEGSRLNSEGHVTKLIRRLTGQSLLRIITSHIITRRIAFRDQERLSQVQLYPNRWAPRNLYFALFSTKSTYITIGRLDSGLEHERVDSQPQEGQPMVGISARASLRGAVQ